MKVSAKTLPKSQVELTIELTVEEVQPFVQRGAKRIAEEVSVPGFRKGRVPYDILKQHVGEAAIYEEAFNDIVNDSYPKAVQEANVEVVGQATIAVEKIAPGNPVIYRATAPLLPKVILGDYKTIKSRKQKTVFDEKRFEKTLLELRRLRSAEKLVVRPAQQGDKVVIDFEVKIAGVPIEGGKANEYGLLLADDHFIPGFVQTIVGMQKGEEKDADLTFPAEYHQKSVAGKRAVVHIRLRDVYEVTLPELTDELAKEMNFDSLAKMKEEIRKNILRELTQEEQERFERAAIEEVVALSTVDELPDQLIDDEAEKMLREFEHDITSRSLKFEDYLSHMKKTREELRAGFRSGAERRLKSALVLRELAVAEKITVEASEIEKELEELRRVYAQVPEALERINSTAQREQLTNLLIHRKTFDRLESLA